MYSYHVIFHFGDKEKKTIIGALEYFFDAPIQNVGLKLIFNNAE